MLVPLVLVQALHLIAQSPGNNVTCALLGPIRSSRYPNYLRRSVYSIRRKLAACSGAGAQVPSCPVMHIGACVPLF